MRRNHRITLLFARIGTSSITSVSRYRPISGQCCLILQSRAFLSSRRTSTTPQDTPPRWADIQEIVRPSAMWLTPEGSKFDQQQVLEQLPKLKDQGGKLPVVLLLVTPKLAHLFENDHPFQSHVVNTIYGESAEGSLRQSIVGVVDALPVLGKLKATMKPEIHGTEGFAVCISPGFDVRPVISREGSPPLITMTSRHPFYDGRNYVLVSWSGGVANTTFINGRQHTLYMQNWWNKDGRGWTPETKRQDLRNVNVQAYANQTGDFLSVVWSSNMIRLTDPKVISSSMGNIVRQIHGPNGQDLAASHELETIVPQMLKELQKTTPTGDLRVFALVYPPELGTKGVFKDHVWDKESKRTETRMRKYNTNLLTLLVRGARLYRVTSGGAGWGKKAGLLSLEPVTELGGSAAEPEFPFFIFEETEDIRMPGSADLFPPGHVIQFIGTFHDTEGSKKDAVPIEEARRISAGSSAELVEWLNPEKGQQFCLGNTVLPETHQYTSLEDIDRTPTSGELSTESTLPNLIFRLNTFGFLTSSALGLSTRYHSPSKNIEAMMTRALPTPDSPGLNTDYRHSSLIELPNSYFLNTAAAGGQVVERAAKQYIGSKSLKELRTISSASLMSDLTVDESIVSASQGLRDAERVQKDSYLARLETLPHGQVSEQPKIIHIPASLVRKHESVPSREAIFRHVETTNKQIDDSLTILMKDLMELEGLSRRQARKLRRFVDHRVRHPDIVPLRYTMFEIPEVLREAFANESEGDVPYRYVGSEMPQELSEVFTNESSGSERYGMEVDEEGNPMREVHEADPDRLIGFEPFEPDRLDPNGPVRSVASVLAWEKHDVTSLMQDSAIFRTYDKADSDGDQQTEEGFDREEERKMVEALTTGL